MNRLYMFVGIFAGIAAYNLAARKMNTMVNRAEKKAKPEAKA